jgi:hypothetical protein
VDTDTADQLARTSSILAVRLTTRWEMGMVVMQDVDQDPTSGREISTTDLQRPFNPVRHLCPDCGEYHADDTETAPLPQSITFPVTSSNQTSVQ